MMIALLRRQSKNIEAAENELIEEILAEKVRCCRVRYLEKQEVCLCVVLFEYQTHSLSPSDYEVSLFPRFFLYTHDDFYE